MNTTLKQIKENDPCTEGWVKLLKFLNKTEADDEQLPISTILESNGLDDAIWALRSVVGRDKEIRLMAADFAESVLHIYEKEILYDDRPRKAIQATRDYANGLIDDAARAAARDAARAATWDAARAAARDAASAAAWAATWDAARDAAWDAARVAASAAAWDAARDAAWDAARAAASAAAWDAAWDAARDAAREKQKEILLKYI